MTPEIYKFIASPRGEYYPIPMTWLEANSHGQIRDQRDGKWFGEVRYQDDFPKVLAGLLPVWSPDVVKATKTPASYFRKRNENEENPDSENIGTGQAHNGGQRKKTIKEEELECQG
ncbi:hypothetical protein [Devosia insulae]|uniref:hypothetical protein n=1 Tax=Devosia insulae TaxID=408174 RepID=UPI00114C9832|nr:hypothetical protein [Devosia insulae]